jgi:hypothetical protein
MPDTHRWATPILLKDGHRLFPSEADPFKQVAIADSSGREPQDTDDGILWLDFERPLLVLRQHFNSETCSIPLLCADDSFTRTLTDVSTLLYLSATFKWPIVDQRNNNTVYKVEER